MSAMHFSDLPEGAKFRFFQRGLLLTKTAKNVYTGPDGEAQLTPPDVEVVPQDDQPAPAAGAAARPDDVALISKALDALEAQGGKTLELAAARQALRRLAAKVTINGAA